MTIKPYFRSAAAGGILCALLPVALIAKTGPIPASLSSIPFKPLEWKVPRGEPYRCVLGNGLVAYIAEDRTLPLFSVSGIVRFGQLNDPKGKEGVCSMLAAVMRTGGTKKYNSDSLDALLDLYAIRVKISASETQMQFGFSCLSDYTGRCLDVLEQMLFHPAFEEKKFKKTRDRKSVV